MAQFSRYIVYLLFKVVWPSPWARTSLMTTTCWEMGVMRQGGQYWVFKQTERAETERSRQDKKQGITKGRGVGHAAAIGLGQAVR